ncbi:hypothetical protein HDU76_001352 [Blyttiomyces sp. JEL0837]|nr:hypothetical protein HDU76_001352 [Blyttiomyces sp. JEL0837]
MVGDCASVSSAFPVLGISPLGTNCCGSGGVTCDTNGRITKLNLSNRGLIGPIPSALGNLANLQELVPQRLSFPLLSSNLYNNQLSGNLPNFLGGLSKLKLLDLTSNQLSGTIPDFLHVLRRITVYSGLESNKFGGNIPDSLGGLSNLVTLSLDYNQLSGRVPDSLRTLYKLETLGLSSNELSGAIPDSLGNLFKIKSLDLSSNQFSGNIPNTLENLLNLEFLGNIPESLGNLAANLTTLFLQNNTLTGEIPSPFSKFQFNSFDVTNNCLTGPPPTNIANLAFVPQSTNCPQLSVSQQTPGQSTASQPTPSQPSDPQPSNSQSGSGTNAAVIAGSIVAVVLIGLVAVVFYCSKTNALLVFYKDADAIIGQAPESRNNFDAESKLPAASSIKLSSRIFAQEYPNEKDNAESIELSTRSIERSGAFNSLEKSQNNHDSVTAKYWVLANPSSVIKSVESPHADVGTSSAPAVSFDRVDNAHEKSLFDYISSNGSAVAPEVEPNLVREFGLPLKWTHAQVMEWARQKLFDEEVIKTFEVYAVDGVLLNSFVRDPTILKEDLGISNFMIRAKIIHSIELLQLEADAARNSRVVVQSTDVPKPEVLPPAYE